ncbi:MAG: dUTP diphosphatase [bacterium]|nr:dUTP diphosphatase [bacterium]
MELKIKKLHPKAKIPTYAHADDAGFDLCSVEKVTIPSGGRVLIGTGIAMEILDGYAGFVWDKSGLSNTHGLKILGGVMDAGYRGEIKIGLVNLGESNYTIEAGHKVAQVVIQKVEHAEIKEVSELSDTVRGHGGFGSTGM